MTSTAFFKDLSLSFIANPVTGNVAPVINEKAVKNALINLIRTQPGERPYDQDFGVDFTKYIFEPADELVEHDINETLAKAIQRFEPRVQLISIESSIEDYGIDVTLTYYVVNFPGIQTIETVVNRTK